MTTSGTATIVRYPPGGLPNKYLPGSFGVVRDWKEDTIGKLIQAGERSRYGHTAWANLTHSFGIVGTNGDIVEANEPGVQRANVSKYKSADFYVIQTEASPEQRRLCVDFWLAQVGAKYDVLDFVGLALQAVFGIDISLHSNARFICSGLVSRGTEKYIVGYPFPSEALKPADLAAYWGLKMNEEPVPLDWFARLLDAVWKTGRLVAAIFAKPIRAAAKKIRR